MSFFLTIVFFYTAVTMVFSLIAGLSKSVKLKNINKVLSIIRAFAVLLGCVYIAFFLPSASSFDITWFIVRIVFVLLLLLFLNFLHKRKLIRATSDLQKIRQEIAAKRNHPLYMHFLIRGDHIHFRSPLEKDLDDILRFDALVTAGADAAIPQMRTIEGKDYWDRYIKCYLQSRTPKSKQEQAAEILASGGWACPCGRANPSYTSTCVCGTNKRENLK